MISNTRNPITRTYQCCHFLKTGTFSFSFMFVFSVGSWRLEVGGYSKNPTSNFQLSFSNQSANKQTYGQPYQQTDVNAFNEKPYDQATDNCYNKRHVPAVPRWLTHAQNPFLKFKAIIFANRRYAPGTPAGNSLKNTSPVYTNFPRP